MDALISIISQLDKYVLTGIPSNLATDLLKAVWKRWTHKDWEQLYLDAFERAVDVARTDLQRYTAEDAEICLDRDALRRVLHQDLRLTLQPSSYSELLDDQRLAQLASALERNSVLVLGGHNLDREGYAQVTRNLVKHAKSLFREAVRGDEEGFKAMLQEVAEETYDAPRKT